MCKSARTTTRCDTKPAVIQNKLVKDDKKRITSLLMFYCEAMAATFLFEGAFECVVRVWSDDGIVPQFQDEKGQFSLHQKSFSRKLSLGE